MWGYFSTTHNYLLVSLSEWPFESSSSLLQLNGGDEVQVDNLNFII